MHISQIHYPEEKKVIYKEVLCNKVLFHLYEITEQTKLIYGVRKETDVCLGLEAWLQEGTAEMSARWQPRKLKAFVYPQKHLTNN